MISLLAVIVNFLNNEQDDTPINPLIPNSSNYVQNMGYYGESHVEVTEGKC